MSFYMIFTIRATRVERWWIRQVKEQYLNAAPTKWIRMNCEYTLAKPGSQKKLPLEER
jgi:hypothetical protein